MFVLGNHELWGFPELSLEQIVEKYRNVLKMYGMYLLHNDLFYKNEADEVGIIPYNKIINEGNQVILKQIKQLKETLSLTPADRQDIIDECNFSISVLEEYAPKMMDESEIKAVIEETLKELSIETPTAQDKGKIMKVLMPKVKGKADGKLVNQVLGSMMA